MQGTLFVESEEEGMAAYRPEFVSQVYKLCLLGLSDTEVAQFFEVSRATLTMWRDKYEHFGKAMKDGRTIADAEVAYSLYQQATGYTRRVIKSQYDKEAGRFVRDEWDEFVQGDVKAQVAWLTFRRRGTLWDAKVDFGNPALPDAVSAKPAETAQDASKIYDLMTKGG